MNRKKIAGILAVALFVIGAFPLIRDSEIIPIIPDNPKQYPGAWVVIIGEAKNRGVNESLIMKSKYAEELRQRSDINFHWFDVTTVRQDLKELAEQVGIPALIIKDEKGNVLELCPLPPMAEFQNVVRQTTGLP